MTEQHTLMPETRSVHFRRLALSFSYFALLLASYNMVRPLRDALAAGSGPATIKYLSSMVFFVMLAAVPVFGALVSRVSRAWLLPLTYGFFSLHLAAFGTIFLTEPAAVWAGRAFYVWTTVFNLFVVSVFWSFMADIWREEEGRRVFGVIAAGGSFGGLCGPLLTHALLPNYGIAGVAFGAAALLSLTIVPIMLLVRERRPTSDGIGILSEPVGGEIFAGIKRLARSRYLLGIAAMTVFGSLLGMIVYIELARFASAVYATSTARTAFFATRDLWVNGLSLLVQFVVVGVLTRNFGVRTTLTGSVLASSLGFVALAVAPVIGVLVFINIGLRVLEFGVAKPSRDMLYTVLDPEAKYKTKNLIDTVIYRGSDATSGWIHDGLKACGASLGQLGLLCVAITAALSLIAYRVGSGYRARGGR
jgi:AAA family ATP:ADP antiporter